MKVTLFHLEREDITIDIVARFQGEVLVIDGFDFGKTVKSYWGGSDYEYTMSINPSGIHRLYEYLKVPLDDKQALLDALASTYNTNHCFSQLEKLIETLKIPNEGYKWT